MMHREKTNIKTANLVNFGMKDITYALLEWMNNKKKKWIAI